MNEGYRQRERRNDDDLPVNNNQLNLTNKRETIDRRGGMDNRSYCCDQAKYDGVRKMMYNITDDIRQQIIV